MNEHQIEETETEYATPAAPITKPSLKRLEPIDRLKYKVAQFSFFDKVLIGTTIAVSSIVGWATFQDSSPISLAKPKKQFNPQVAINFSAEQSAQFVENYQAFLSQEKNNLVALEARRTQDAVLKELKNHKNPNCYRLTYQSCLANSINKLAGKMAMVRETNTVVLNANEYSFYLAFRAEVLGFAANFKTIPVSPPNTNLLITQTSDFSKLLKIQSSSSEEGEAIERGSGR